MTVNLVSVELQSETECIDNYVMCVSVKYHNSLSSPRIESHSGQMLVCQFICRRSVVFSGLLHHSWTDRLDNKLKKTIDLGVKHHSKNVNLLIMYPIVTTRTALSHWQVLVDRKLVKNVRIKTRVSHSNQQNRLWKHKMQHSQTTSSYLDRHLIHNSIRCLARTIVTIILQLLVSKLN